MDIFKKPPTEKQVIERLRTGQLDLPPLRFEVLESSSPNDQSPPWDAIVEARWQDERVLFAVECKAASTPKAFEETVRQATDLLRPRGCLPLIVLPYLRDSQLAELEQRGLSGVDLCGNGVVVAPGKFSVYRTGAKNQFPSYSPIKNVYRKNTSMVARALMAKPSYAAVQDLRDEINARNVLVARWGKTPMSPGTVSKALKGLEDDLIVDRRDGVRILQADKLLDRLSESYVSPSVTNRVRMKIDCGPEELTRLIREKSDAAIAPVVATGLSSVPRYAVMQRDEILSVYCPRGDALLKQLPGKEDSRFPNFELLETEEQPVYFDAREEKGFLWASPLQTYLELAAGDKRDRETAEQVRSYLLNGDRSMR